MFCLKWKKKNFLKKKTNKLHEMLQTARCRLTLKIMMQTFRLWCNVIIWKMASFFSHIYLHFFVFSLFSMQFLHLMLQIFIFKSSCSKMHLLFFWNLLSANSGADSCQICQPMSYIVIFICFPVFKQRQYKHWIQIIDCCNLHLKRTTPTEKVCFSFGFDK